MNPTRAFLLAMGAALLAQPAVVPASADGFPFAGETLEYKVKYASGIPLGDVRMTARRDPVKGWSFNFTLDASIPAFPIIDRFSAFDTLDLCSLRFSRSFDHGSRKAQEVTYVDRNRAVAVRSTRNGGGLSEIPIGSCPHDALSFLYYLRREMAQGRKPASDLVLAGAQYNVSMVYVGQKSVERDKKKITADRVNFIIKGPKSETQVEILFARDAARTPLVVRSPFALGTISLELVR